MTDDFDDIGWREYMRGIENGNIDPSGERLRLVCKLAREALAATPAVGGDERFFIDHGVIHDRVTGKHIVTDGEWPFEDDLPRVLALLNSLAVQPATPAVGGEPVAWRVYCTTNGATGYLYTEQLPFEPGLGVRVRREPEPLYAAQPASPLPAVGGEDKYDPAYDEGITYAIRMLADLTGSKDWQIQDGSEDHETDVRNTIMDVLKCAGLYDDEDGKFAAFPQALETLIREYARDLRRNSSGGDDYPWEIMIAVADYLEVLIGRATPPEQTQRNFRAQPASPLRVRNDALEEAAQYHDRNAACCRAIALVNLDNDLGTDSKIHAVDHEIAAEDIRSMKVSPPKQPSKSGEPVWPDNYESNDLDKGSKA